MLLGTGMWLNEHLFCGLRSECFGLSQVKKREESSRWREQQRSRPSGGEEAGMVQCRREGVCRVS